MACYWIHTLVNQIITRLFLHLFSCTEKEGLVTFFIVFAWLSIIRLTIIRLWFYHVLFKWREKEWKGETIHKPEIIRDNNLRLDSSSMFTWLYSFPFSLDTWDFRNHINVSHFLIHLKCVMTRKYESISHARDIFIEIWKGMPM